MPRDTRIKKVLVIGSGPIVIGQAAEFDYAGTQACRSLKEEGIEVVLLNSNPATIMTDKDIADEVYIEPLTVPVLKKVIEKEKPDSILPTLGGQAGLNLAMEIAETGFLEEHNCRLIGTTSQTIKKAEDRLEFKETMEKIGEPCAPSLVVENVEDGIEFTNKIGYPVVLRPASTMGGAGGGLVYNVDELKTVCARGLQASMVGQVLVEESILGWEELELEVVRDAKNNLITVCFIENIDPLGVHTGDSFCSAPMLTISEECQQRLQEQAYKIVDSVQVIGGTNVQFAHDPVSDRIVVIEINPRTSRSSALASKATGFPIALVSAMLAAGLTMEDIPCGKYGTLDKYVPDGDYVVIKFARWAFEKFKGAEDKLGTQMKAVGEVMSIGTNFEGALMKAIRSLEQHVDSLLFGDYDKLTDDELLKELEKIDDLRIYVIAEAIRRGFDYDTIFNITKIDRWFLDKIAVLVEMEKKLAQADTLDKALLQEAKRLEFPDKVIGSLTGKTEREIKELRNEYNIHASYKMVDTCAAEFDAATPYYYSCYDGENEVEETSGKKKVMVLGSGPIRIGQGIEFDYCSVHASWALRGAGKKSIVINNNPETVSTDFDTSDSLYFEPLSEEDVLEIIEKEKPEGVICQFGGQTAINLATPMAKRGIRIIGSSNESIDMAEDRERFDTLMGQLGIARPKGCLVESVEEAMEKTRDLDYPLIVRPSYVLGGRAMQIVYDQAELRQYLKEAVVASHEHPVLIDQYMVGREVEVDAISDGIDVCIPGIMEQIERSGVHSGDSIAVYPPQHLTQETIETLTDYTREIARAMNVKGLINIQFIVVGDKVYVIEVNPRASRTVPFMSKITGINMVEYATRIALGESLELQGLPLGLVPDKNYVAIKAPVFSFSKLGLVEIKLGPEMKSTGEVMGIGHTYQEALYKAVVAANLMIPAKGNILITVSDRDKPETAELAKRFVELGYHLISTSGTGEYFKNRGIPVEIIRKIHEKGENCEKYLKSGKVDMVLNTISYGSQIEQEGYDLRRIAVELAIPCLTSLDTAREVLRVMAEAAGENRNVEAIQDYIGEN